MLDSDLNQGDSASITSSKVAVYQCLLTHVKSNIAVVLAGIVTPANIYTKLTINRNALRERFERVRRVRESCL